VEKIKEKLGALFFCVVRWKEKRADMNSTPRSATTLQDYGKFFSVAGSLDISFGSLFLKAPFCPKKGVFKGQK
jgi:hypothetical protein